MEAVRSGEKLQNLLRISGQVELSAPELERFEKYLRLFLLWNGKTNLSAIREEDGILARHFVESIACARQLPAGITTLLDFGSGGGFPGVPITICRPEIAVTLAESQGKKAIFLQEVVRQLELKTRVHSRRAEELREQFDCVAMRAVDKMFEAIPVAAGLVRPAGLLALMSTVSEQQHMQKVAGSDFEWLTPIEIPGGEARLLLLGRKS